MCYVQFIGYPQKTSMESKLVCKTKELLFKLKFGPSMCPKQDYNHRVPRSGRVCFLFFIIVKVGVQGSPKVQDPDCPDWLTFN